MRDCCGGSACCWCWVCRPQAGPARRLRRAWSASGGGVDAAAACGAAAAAVGDGGGAPAAGWASVVSPARVVGVEGRLELDCPIEVEVAGLREWAKDNDPRRLVPFIDGYPIAGNTPVAIDLQHGRLLFHLAITRES